MEYRDEDLIIGGICVGTGVGDYMHYCNRPASKNDLHGTGAFLLMCTEVERVKAYMEENRYRKSRKQKKMEAAAGLLKQMVL